MSEGDQVQQLVGDGRGDEVGLHEGTRAPTGVGARTRIDSLRSRTSPARRWVAQHPGATVVGVAALVRLLAWATDLPEWSARPGSDSHDYLAMADRPSGYWNPDATNWLTGFKRTPGYPALLAFPRLLSEAVWVSALLGVALGVLVAWLCWRLGDMLAGPAVGLVAGLLVAIDPNSVTQSVMLLSDTAFAALLVAAMWTFGRGLRSRSSGLMAIAGLLLASAVLVRPIGLYLPVALVLAGVVAMALHDRRHISLVPLVVLLLTATIPVGGWWIRNATTEGVRAISTIQGVNLLQYRGAASVAEETSQTIDDVRADLLQELDQRLGDDPTLGDTDRERSALGIELIRDHPLGYLRQAGKGAARTLVAPGRTELRLLTEDLPAPGSASTALQAGSSVLAAALCVGGVVGTTILARRRRWTDLAVLTVPIVTLLVVGSGLDSDSRFRIPLTPLLAVLTAIACQRWWTRSRFSAPRTSRTGRRSGPGAGGAAFEG